jgi:5,6-dimethylbenzimidazole synthase
MRGIMDTNGSFSDEERAAIYRCIYKRRDVRGEFIQRPVPLDVIERILEAAHHAPSVGLMQPWDFVVVGNRAVKERIHSAFLEANGEAAALFEPSRSTAYRDLKLEGILEAPLGICVTCDRARAGPIVLGRTHQPDMDLYSTVCAIQTLWLAARAEGIGVGWVSIIRPEALKVALGIPAGIVPVAYLCVGYTHAFHEKAELEKRGWAKRTNFREHVAWDRWRQR